MSSFLIQIKRRCRRGAILLLSLVAVFQVGKVDAQTDTFNNADNLIGYLPVIQATNFVNDGIFNTTGGDFSQGWLASLYRNWQYTLNFTNYGEMYSFPGFNFINWIPNNSPDAEASSFYNQGSIFCNANAYGFYGYGGGINVFATNIYNGGEIALGADSYAKFYGDTVMFDSGSILRLAAPVPLSTNYGYVLNNVYAVGQADTSTNKWSPQSKLTESSATGVMNKTPYSVILNNSTPYFKINVVNATNVLVRMMFVQDNSGFGVTTAPVFKNSSDGGAHIEWTGTYTDPASGQAVSKYLELDDNMQASGSTNILSFGDPAGGVPPNFTVSSSANPLYNTNSYAVPSFVANLLSPGTVTTNIYSYLNAQLIPSDVSLNSVLHGAPNLLPGRLEITASKSLNLSQAGVSVNNYLLLNSTNEFDADAQSAFAVPYSDLYLGRTNGYLTLTNLIASTLPTWSGSVQAWGTTWTFTDTNKSLTRNFDTNGILGTNNILYEYRVLVVSSQLTPYSGSQQGTVNLNASNTVVISDALNVTSNLFVNCTNLVLTSNGTGVGASSISGQLNVENYNLSWQAATPRLNNLLNNGQINLSYSGVNIFGSSSAPYGSLINSGLISCASGATFNTGDFENYGTLSSGAGKLIVQSSTTTMTNAEVWVGTVYSNAATTMSISGTWIEVGQSLTLAASSILTDTGVINGNYWTVGYNNQLINSTGLVLPVKPVLGDLLGTTIQVLGVTPNGKTKTTWAAVDRGAANVGFSNNVALGQLILDGIATNSQFVFSGTGTSNAIYVDSLQLLDFASYQYHNGLSLPSMIFSNNLVIYYAQAMSDGISVAEKLNGFNNGHLRWVPSYVGQYSSTSIVYPDGTTNMVNSALAGSSDIDSNGNGNPNNLDPAPIFVPSQVKFSMVPTNVPPQFMRLQWSTVPNATNYVEYTTNINQTGWIPLTNFGNYYFGAGIAVTNSNHVNWFLSPQSYPGPVTNVWVLDPITGTTRFYRVCVKPWLTYPQ